MMAELLPAPVFADILQLIVFFVVILFSILGQVFNKEKPKPQKQRRRKQPPQQPQGPQQPAKPVETTIEDFIRRVTEPPKRDGTIRDKDVNRERSMPKRPVAEQRSPKRSQRPAQRPTHEEDIVVIDRADNLTSRDQHLAQRIEHRDEAMVNHMQDVFSHPLGDLKQQAAAEVQREFQTGMTASEVATLFQSHDDLRKAIIMQEILNRPDFEWE